MSSSCSSCGSSIPDGQGSSCSMCYGDIAYGSDGYYEEWAKEQLHKEEYERHVVAASQEMLAKAEGEEAAGHQTNEGSGRPSGEETDDSIPF